MRARCSSRAASPSPIPSAVTVAGRGATFDLNSSNETIGSLAGGGAAGGNVTLGTGTVTTGGNQFHGYSGRHQRHRGADQSRHRDLHALGRQHVHGCDSDQCGHADAGGRQSDSPMTVRSTWPAAIFNLNNFGETIGSLAGAGNVTLGTGTLTAAETMLDHLSGIVSGTGGLAEQGTGIFTLSGNNTYSGVTTSCGHLCRGQQCAGTAAGGTTVAAGATWASPAGSTMPRRNRSPGATTISAGTLQLGAANRIANTSAVTVNAGATFNLNNFAETIGSLAGAGNVTLGTGTLTTGGNNTSHLLRRDERHGGADQSRDRASLRSRVRTRTPVRQRSMRARCGWRAAQPLRTPRP